MSEQLASEMMVMFEYANAKGEHIIFMSPEKAVEIMAVLKVNAGRIKVLEEELANYRSGYKGACYACETVGELNIKLRAENAALKVKLNAYEQLAWDFGGKIEALEAEIATLRESMRWIPVSERLPGVYEFVIARNAHYKIAQVSPAQYDHVNSVWKDIQDVRVDGTWEDLPCVTHWMPLPPPPTEQEQTS